MKTRELNVLIVDDKQQNLLVMESVLEDIDCTIFKSESGNDALRLMLENDFALVLLDVRMPNMDGYEIVEFMKLNDKTRNIPIILVTADYNESKQMIKGYQLGIVDYLYKPIEPFVLKSKVNVFLELHKEKLKVIKQAETLKENIIELESLQYENNRLETISIRDGLTGIYNRRFFENIYDRSFKNAMRSRKPLSIIIADIDFFKNYNDHYGHLSGDDCLFQVAQTIQSCIKRPLDVVTRFGGEEFAIVLPETGVMGAAKLAEDIRLSIFGKQIEHANAGDLSCVTASLGVATMAFDEDNITEKELLKRADVALYEAKKRGRNAVSIFNEIHPSDMGPDFQDHRSMHTSLLLEIEKLNISDAKNKTNYAVNLEHDFIIAKEELLELMIEIVRVKDNYTSNHSKNVDSISVFIAQLLNLSNKQREIVHIAASLHDIGKIGVDDSTLRKTGSLTNSEMDIIRIHSIIGEKIISKLSCFDDIGNIVRSHHEKYNGSGYPDGLKGDEIPLESRIIAVADALDAMVCGRVYKKPMSIDEITLDFEKCSGEQFDPSIIELVIPNLKKMFSNITIS